MAIVSLIAIALFVLCAHAFQLREFPQIAYSNESSVTLRPVDTASPHVYYDTSPLVNGGNLPENSYTTLNESGLYAAENARLLWVQRHCNDTQSPENFTDSAYIVRDIIRGRKIYGMLGYSRIEVYLDKLTDDTANCPYSEYRLVPISIFPANREPQLELARMSYEGGYYRGDMNAPLYEYNSSTGFAGISARS
jgi:hypothetical protein